MKLTWNDDKTISIAPPKRTKKVTGTRFGAVLGANKWTTPFDTWCSITKVYDEPFVDTIYTTAGKIIEPKQAQFMADKYFFNKLVTPSDVFGQDYFRMTRGDFFPENKIFGGMWDYLFVDKNGNPTTVLEMKTTKRAEDWLEDIPEYYALQAALYAHLLDIDDVIMVCTVLSEKDYENPESFEVNENNTFERRFKVSERYPNFASLTAFVTRWWVNFVETGTSPQYDEVKDKELLKILRTGSLNPETDIRALMLEAEKLKSDIDLHDDQISVLRKRYKEITAMLKEYAEKQMTDDLTHVTLETDKTMWQLSRSETLKINEKKLKEAGLFEKYSTPVVSYRFTNKNKGDK